MSKSNLKAFTAVIAVFLAAIFTGCGEPDAEIVIPEGMDAEAVYQLGVRYDAGYGVKQDKKLAVQYFRKAAEQGHAGAQVDLGAALFSGEGVDGEIPL